MFLDGLTRTMRAEQAKKRNPDGPLYLEAVDLNSPRKTSHLPFRGRRFVVSPWVWRKTKHTTMAGPSDSGSRRKQDSMVGSVLDAPSGFRGKFALVFAAMVSVVLSSG